MSKASRAFDNSAKTTYGASIPHEWSWSSRAAANDDLPKVSDMPANRTVVIRPREIPNNIRDRFRVQREHHEEIMAWCKSSGIRVTCPMPLLMRDDNGNKVFVMTFKKPKHAVMAKLAWG